MDNSAIRSVVIAGNGLDAWSTAAAIAHAFQGHGMNITVVGDSAANGFSTEAALPINIAFHQRLGISEQDLMKACSATFNLGVQINSWVAPDHQYFQPMGAHGASIEFVQFHNYVNKARLNGLPVDWNSYSLCAAAAKKGRFSHPSPDPQSILSTLVYGHHIDADQYTAYMRAFAEHLNVQAVSDNIEDVEYAADKAFIAAVKLANGDRIEADLFIDCSGAEARLIRTTPGAERDAWTQWFPANRAVTARCANTSLPAHSSINADDNGWHQVLPMQTHSEHRFLFDSTVTTDEQARQKLVELSGCATDDIASVDLTPGTWNKLWSGNCVALGEAAGQQTPLDGSRLALLQAGLMRLINLFPGRACSPLLAAEYNEVTLAEHQNIRDFHLLHFLGSQRTDSPFWAKATSAELPESLAYKTRLFNEHGQVAFYEEESYPDTNWVSVWLGQDRWPDSYDPILDNYDFERLNGRFRHMQQLIGQAVESMPPHEEYIKQFCGLA